MNNIESITKKIAQDAQAQADQKIAEAQSEAQQILRGYQEQADKLLRDAQEQAQTSAYAPVSIYFSLTEQLLQLLPA